MLRFDDEASFVKSVDLLNKIYSKDLKQDWEQQLGFISVSTLYDKSIAELSEKPYSIESIMDKARQYEEVMYLEQTNDGERLALSIPSPFSCVLNQNGLVKVGKSLIKHCKNGQYLVVNGDMNVLQSLINGAAADEKNSFFFKNNNIIERACGLSIPMLQLDNSSGNRRSELFHTLSWNNLPGSNGTINRTYFVDIRGEARKKNLLGNWNLYKTDHTLDYNFTVGIFNANALSNAGVNTSTLNTVPQIGTRTRSNWEVVAHATSIGFINSIPANLAPNADPFWNTINVNRHQTQGIYPLWNSFSCN